MTACLEPMMSIAIYGFAVSMTVVIKLREARAAARLSAMRLTQEEERAEPETDRSRWRGGSFASADSTEWASTT